MSDTSPNSIEFFWDPICPFAWQTSRWLRRVAALRDLTVTWRFINLSILNEGRDYDTEFPEGYAESHMKGRYMLRVAAAVQDAEGSEAMGALYEAFGESIWNRVLKPGADHRTDIATEEHLQGVLTVAGFSTDYAAARHDESWDEILRTETEVAVGRTGRDVGTPILTFGAPDGPSIFGPVISAVPESDADCLELFDATMTLSKYSTFSELKRSNRESLDLPIVAGRLD